MLKNKLQGVFTYISKSCSKKKLDKKLLIQLVYLSDWKNTLTFGKQITEADWQFESCGPDCNIKDIKLSSVENLSKDEISSINHVLKVTSKLNSYEIIKLVYSTYPILSTERYSKLDLVEKSKEYQNNG